MEKGLLRWVTWVFSGLLFGYDFSGVSMSLLVTRMS